MWLDTVSPDGDVGRAWVPSAPEGEARRARLYWRADFVAPAPLFTVDVLGLELATDELVGRVRRAGLSGITFLDAANGKL